MKSNIRIGGYFTVDCYGPDGELKWTEVAHNLVTNEGLDHLLDVLLGGATQSNPWYVGLKESGSPAAGDTLLSHPTWSENSNYTGTRKEYVEASATSQSVTNSANKASFSIDTDTQTINGAFLASVTSGTSGVLLCAADFSSAKSLDSGDTLEVTYTISAADDGV